MQVNLSANLFNPAGEINAKSAEVAEEGAAKGFYAQMGQILNQGNDNKKDYAAPAPSVPASNSAEKNARRSLLGSSSLLPQALSVEQAPVQNVSSALPQLFHDSEDAGTESQDAGDAQALAERSGGIPLASGMESIPVLTGSAEKGIADLHPSFQFPGDPSVAAGTAPPVTAVDSDDPAGLLSSVRQAGSWISSLTGKRMATGITDRGSLEETSRKIKEVGINSEGYGEYPAKPTGNTIQDFQMLDLRPTLQAGIENAPQSVSEYAKVVNESDMQPVPQDQPLNAQLNLDFIAAETAASRRGKPGQPEGIGERQDEILTDNLALSENAKSQIDDAPVTILKKSPRTMQSSLENSDTATVSDAQGQTLDKLRPWVTTQGKPEHGQLHSEQQPLSMADRQPQIQSVFASSPAQYEESAGAVSAPPAQSSTSHAPELYSQLADQIRIQVRDGKGEIRIQLKPDNLGRLEISAESTAHGVSARISTDSSAVKSYLENNLQLLQQTLQDQGLKIDRIHIVVQDAFSSKSFSGYTSQFGHAGSGQNGKESQLSSEKSSASPMDPIDETGLDPASWHALNPNSSFYTVA